MTDRPDDKTLLPSSLAQNPAPVEVESQDRMTKVRSQVDRIMEVFTKVLPSNYVAQVTGPYYTIQYQALAEQIAEFQITAQEVFADSDYEYTRSEFLWQILGSLVFPDAATVGAPDIPGDISYRTFLRRMVELLLQGATAKTQREGIELLTDATVEIIERAVAARQTPGDHSAWGPADQFVFEVNISQTTTVEVGGEEVVLYTFPEDTFRLQRNVQLVLRALKPAHTLYDYRHLFKETFGPLFTEQFTSQYEDYHYQDLRRFWLGAERITGEGGATLANRTLFSDSMRDFSSINPGAVLAILSGPNASTGGFGSTKEDGYPGRYRVISRQAFLSDDSTPRRYTTSPTGLTGKATVLGDVATDTSQDWGLAVEGEILTFSAGLNIGASFRLKTLLGAAGGLVGVAHGPATKVRVAPSILRVEPRMGETQNGQLYTVGVDRLGVQGPVEVVGEDVSITFTC
jgi:hypothetical protein